VVHHGGHQLLCLCKPLARDTLGQWEVDVAALSGKSAFQCMDEEAAKPPVGANGLFFHPYLLGKRARTSILICAQALSERP
jgi:hypothetical protein